MKKNTTDLVEFFDSSVLPHLTPEIVYTDVIFTKKSSRYWRGGCPLHGGKDPNFSVDTQTLRWVCFSHCGTGSVLDYVNGGKPARGRDFVEAVKYLAQLAGVPFPEREWDHEKLKQAEKRERRANLLESFLANAREELMSTGTHLAREYFLTRGFPESCLQDLGFGFYTSPSNVKVKLQKCGFSEDEIYESGILGTKDKDKEGWNALSGRIVGSFSRNYGRLQSIWAGYVNKKPPKGGPPPYITIGSKSIPFGLDKARRLGRKNLLLVEGPLKALLPYSMGLDEPFPIASGGDLTTEQITILQDYLRHGGSLTINWDYDSEAVDGIHGRTLRTLDRLSHVSFKVYVVNPSLMVQGGSSED